MTLHLLPPPNADGTDPDIRPGLASDVLGGLADHLAYGAARLPVATGIPAVDDLGGGLCPGSVTAVVAHPDARPTRLLFDAALRAARDGHSTCFYELDQGLGAFAETVAEAVGPPTGPSGPRCAGGGDALRTAARDLAQLPLRVSVGYSVGIHDILAVAHDEDPVALVVVDNCDLLLPTGDVRDLKRLATYLDAAVLCSAVRLVDGEPGGVGIDLIAAADTTAWYGPDGGCRLLFSRTGAAGCR